MNGIWVQRQGVFHFKTSCFAPRRILAHWLIMGRSLRTSFYVKPQKRPIPLFDSSTFIIVSLAWIAVLKIRVEPAGLLQV